METNFKEHSSKKKKKKLIEVQNNIGRDKNKVE